jgi:hypothetical protein
LGLCHCLRDETTGRTLSAAQRFRIDIPYEIIEAAGSVVLQ